MLLTEIEIYNWHNVDNSFGDGDLIGVEGEDDEGSCQGKASQCLQQGSMVWTHHKQICKKVIFVRNIVLMDVLCQASGQSFHSGILSREA